ncbi:MAG: hypothetical protein RhofKO_15680 [Rhodothermales bacterium]
MNRPLFVFVWLVGLSGCITAADVELPAASPVLVVDARFTPVTPWTVLLQRSVPLGPESPLGPLPVTDADVQIAGSDGTRLPLEHVGGGLYSAAVHPDAGVTYTLTAEAPGLPPVHATDAVPDRPRVYGATMHRLIVHDPQGAQFYEILRIDQYGAPSSFRIQNPELRGQLLGPYDDDLLEPTAGDSYTMIALFDDAAFDGSSYEIRFGDDAGGVHATHVRSVTSAYQQYMRVARTQDYVVGNPFIEPFSVPSNVQGGNGLFAGYATSVVGSQTEEALRHRLQGRYRIQQAHHRRFTTEVDLVAAGAEGRLDITHDLKVKGYLHLPPFAQGMDTLRIDLDGGYRMEGNRIRLYHGTGSLINHHAFFVHDRRMTLSMDVGTHETLFLAWTPAG